MKAGPSIAPVAALAGDPARANMLAPLLGGKALPAGEFGIALEHIARNRRPLCIGCLDWSMRREHLAGALGAALLDRIFALGWARRDRNGRAVFFDGTGEKSFKKIFRLS